MRRLLLAALMTAPLALSSPALAQNAGRYTIQGSNADGSTYSGTLDLEPGGRGVWRVTWRVDSTPVRGLGVVQGDVLAVAYVDSGSPGVVAYRILPNGQLDGPWSVGQGVGRELLTPVGGPTSGPAGGK